MKQNIFDWYSSEYPNDYKLDEIRNVTFEDKMAIKAVFMT
jgi:hypothetical protein